MSWTDERIDILKKLWSEGLSASQIAKELGGVTRNGVIGKVHRLLLSGRQKPVVRKSRSAKEKSDLNGGAEAAIMHRIITKRKERAARASQSKMLPRQELQGLPAKPTHRNNWGYGTVTKEAVQFLPAPPSTKAALDLPLLEVEDGMCHWPTTHRDGQQLYCGLATGSRRTQYCPMHANAPRAS